MIRARKAGVQWPLIALFFLLAVALLLSSDSLLKVSNELGTRQYEILSKIEELSAANIYIDQAATYASARTKEIFFTSAGIYQQLSAQGDVLPSRCGRYLYPNYNSADFDCTPVYMDSLERYFGDLFFNYLQDYPSTSSLYFLHTINFVQTSPQELLLQAKGEPISFSFQEEKTISYKEDKTCENLFYNRKLYPTTALGIYTQEKPITCSTGDCFAQVADLLYETYRLQHKSYPYIVHGESPYCPQDVSILAGNAENPTASQENMVDPFFSDITIPEGRYAQRIQQQPGFDSAGWLWWVGKHANITFFTQRLGQANYLELALTQGVLCKETACTLAFIKETIQPGDIFFIRGEKKVREDGTSVGQGSIHLAIFVGFDTTGALLIIHADPNKGLVKEPLPKQFISSQDSHVVALFRPPYQSSGVATLPEELIALPPFIGPFEWCAQDADSLPSDAYLARLQEQPFKSSVTSYYDLIISTAVETGIDPALLATHMVLESSMGINDGCTSQGKSSLTGCDWPVSCARDCSCTGPFVISDEAQVTCTAQTDAHAYEEAIAGEDKGFIGRYEECSAYKNQPELFWNCIFCIYQGNYEKVIDGKKQYFTQDKTCEYAQRAKEVYCSWRNYFDAHWSDLSSLSSLTPESKASFTPGFSTSLRINLAGLETITAEFLPLLNACADDLPICVTNAITTFNKENENVLTITRLEGKHEQAHHLIEEVLDCRFNQQQNCVCPIIPLSTQTTLPDNQYIFFSNGTMLANNTTVYTFPFNPAISAHNLTGSRLAAGLTLNVSANKYSLAFDMTGTGTFTKEQERWTAPLTYDISAQQNNFLRGIGLFKQTYTSMIWLPYTQNITHLTCRDNKHFFSLQAKSLPTGETLNFSVYLQDTQPPSQILQPTASTGVCLETPRVATPSQDLSSSLTELFSSEKDVSSFFSNNEFAVLGLANTATLSWQTPDEHDTLYAFQIDITPNTPDFSDDVTSWQVPVASALELSATIKEPKLLNQLARHNGFYDRYSFKISKESLTGKPFQEDTTYFYRVTAIDHYGNNATPSIIASFNFTDPYASILPLSEQQLAVLRAGTQVTTTGVENFLCVENNQFFITPKDLISIQQGNVLMYPGLSNPLTPHEPLYQIADIPHVVCDESQTSVGKICAGTEELVIALQQLSEELVERDWTLVVTQAHRTWDIQYALWEQSGFDRTMACDPGEKNDPYPCPHMLAGAVDITILDSSGSPITPLEQEAFMCKHQFVRYGMEWWHFEYGTEKWDAAQTARATGSCCYYGAKHPDDERDKACII